MARAACGRPAAGAMSATGLGLLGLTARLDLAASAQTLPPHDSSKDREGGRSSKDCEDTDSSPRLTKPGVRPGARPPPPPHARAPAPESSRPSPSCTRTPESWLPKRPAPPASEGLRSEDLLAACHSPVIIRSRDAFAVPTSSGVTWSRDHARRHHAHPFAFRKRQRPDRDFFFF